MIMDKPKCTIEGCEKPKRSRGMCSSHYERWRLKGHPGTTPLRAYRDYVNPCTVDGCDRPRVANKMCKAHNDRKTTSLPLDAPVRVKSPNGLTAEEAFALRASGEPTAAGCVLWSGNVLPSGYGSLSVAGYPKLAHRVAWETANGRRIPAGLVIRHTCDVPLCVAPGHLVLGTYADNSSDMTRRNRQALGGRVSTARMTEDAVRELRRLRTTGMTYDQLSKRFEISRSQVFNIVHRASWKHVD